MPHNTIRSFVNLQAEFERVQRTIADLKQNGHPCPDAELQLKEIEDELLRSPSKPR